MSIVYVSCLMPAERFYRMFRADRSMPGQQAQKYHRLLAQGFALSGETVTALSLPPVNRANYAGLFVRGAKEQEGGVRFLMLPTVNLPGIRHLAAFVQSFVRTFGLLCKQKDAQVVLDVLSLSVSLGAALAARCLGRAAVGIVTDLPEMMDTNNRGWGARLSGRLIGLCTHYVFLTAAMSDRLDPDGKPYVVIEGQVDAALSDQAAEDERKSAPAVLLYAGEISRRYGLETLARGFLRAGIEGAELHYYGYGDYADDFARLSTRHGSLRYMGVRPNSEVTEAERRATLLINPRPTTEKFTRYSFPSKNMEYMASGTPVMTTRLPGMPDCYLPHVYLFDGEQEEDMAASLRAVLSLPKEALRAKGQAARRFVLAERNNAQAAGRILRMLREGNP